MIDRLYAIFVDGPDNADLANVGTFAQDGYNLVHDVAAEWRVRDVHPIAAGEAMCDNVAGIQVRAHVTLVF